MPLTILLNGMNGRMGSRIKAAAQDSGGAFQIGAECDKDRVMHGEPGTCTILIDFSSDGGARMAATLAADLKLALLVGTTGLSDETKAILREASRTVPLLVAPNTSLGVAVLKRLTAMAARLLGDGFSVDIIEHHHTKKVDAPSGTAKALAEAIAAGGGTPLPPERIHAIRAGSIIGEHSVQFAGGGEVVNLSHSAGSRDLFAQGALRLAAWLAKKPPGIWTIDDWLDERSKA